MYHQPKVPTQGEISFSDINKAISLPGDKTRTLRSNNRCAYLDSTPYENRENPKASHWRGYVEDHGIQGFNGPVYCVTKQPDGKILVGGSFTFYKNHYPCVCIARLNSDLSFDETFNPWLNGPLGGSSYDGILGGSGFGGPPNGYSDSVYGFVYFPLESCHTNRDGFFSNGEFITYEFSHYEKNHRTGNSNDPIIQPIGSSVHVITIWGSDDPSRVNDIHIFVGGRFTAYNGTPANSIIKLYANGSIDTDFITNSGLGFRNRVYTQPIGGISSDFYEDTAHVFDIVINPIELPYNMIVTGDFYNYNNHNIFGLCKVDLNGLFTPFKGSIGQWDYSNFNATIGHVFTRQQTYNQNYYGRSIMLHSEGITKYSSSNNSYMVGVITVVGSFEFFNGTTVNNIVCVDLDGKKIDRYESGFNGEVKTLVEGSEGSIYVGGHFTEYRGTTSNKIVKINRYGYIDFVAPTQMFTFDTGRGFISPIGLSFNNDSFFVNKIIITSETSGSNGTSGSSGPKEFLIVIGAFFFYNGGGCNNIVALNTDGSRNTTFKVDNSFTGDQGGSFASEREKYKDYPKFIDGVWLSTNLSSIIVNNDKSLVIGGRFDYYGYSPLSLQYPSSMRRYNPNCIIKLTNTAKVDRPIGMIFDYNYRIIISTIDGIATWYEPTISLNDTYDITIDNLNPINLDPLINDILPTPPTIITEVNSSTTSTTITTGTITITGFGSQLTFTPNGKSGNQTFTYTITDNLAGKSTSTINLNVSSTIIDTQAPSIVRSLSINNVYSNEFTTYWTAATDNFDVAGYNIVLDAIPFATVLSNTLSYHFVGLEQSTLYTVSVAAFDAAGNVGLYTSVSVTTPEDGLTPY